VTPDEQKAALEALNTSLDRLAANLRAAWPELEKRPAPADVVVLAEWKRSKETKA
jgi:hypothetical protein